MALVRERALTLDSPLATLSRVTSADLKRLGKLGLATARDLLLYLPYDWEPYGDVRPIASLRPGDAARAEGVLSVISARVSPRRHMRLTEARIRDESGGELKLVWFNQPYIANQLKRGDRLVVAGVVKPARVGAALELQNPHYERVGDSADAQRVVSMIPKYHLTGGLTSRRIATLVDQVLPLAAELPEVLPAEIRRRHRLLGVTEAVRKAHQPADESEWKAARHRLAWQELFELQLAFVLLRRDQEDEAAAPVAYSQDTIDGFKAGLGFDLTRAQKRAAWDIFRDMERPVPMNRLLNGDVGSGKTAVAAAAVAMAYASGKQSVVMAPTEVLARQHLSKFRAYLEPSFKGLTVELLVSGQSAPERRRVMTAVASGHCALLVGTHALIQEGVDFADLGLAVVDEQHRFGTGQREALRAKGRSRPHFLAMTATPIPRTLALAQYGEMSLSIIDELPPGRTPVRTSVVNPDEREKAYGLVRREVAAGRQAFVICPLIEESEATEARAATAEYERLRTTVFPDLRMSLVHGRVRDKDAVMSAFARGESDVLVATAVVEVGVDVPNATVMLIEGAERFGLAQLHQFRGRVGRGAHESHCLLLVDEASPKAGRRLDLMAQIHDGFRLAEEDMKLRGAGELLGSRQHGLSDQAMEVLLQPRLLDEVRQEAEAIFASDPTLADHLELRNDVTKRLLAASIS